ncbi:MAG TPA: hypothetical protein VFU36_11065 [Jatrophihabitans sp.]|nr:hypothetical protein [Jatrophihabitans sp.]
MAVEVVTGAAALAGGVALMAAPDGSLLRADPQALAGSPFEDWRWPGLLLATLVGGGYLLTALLTARRWRYARELTMLAGAGLVAFEAAELAWIGPQPLEFVFAGVGGYLVVAGWREHGQA